MRYDEIIKFGFSKAWQYKSLWLLGLLAGGTSFNLNIPGEWKNESAISEKISIFLAQNLALVIILVMVAMFIGLCFFVLSIISQGGLIEAGARLHRNLEYRFGQVFKAGARRFWAMLGITILLIIIVMATILVFFMIGFILWNINKIILAFSLLLLIPMIIFCIFYTTMAFGLAQRALIIEGLGVFDSIGEGVTLLHKNFGSCIVIALISFAIAIAIGLAVLAILVSVALPFIGIGMSGNILLALVLGLPVVFLIMLVIEGYTGAANSLLMTAFYMELPNRTPLTTHDSPAPTDPSGGYTPPQTVGPYPPMQPPAPPTPPAEPFPPADIPPPDDPYPAPPPPPESDEPPPPPQQG